MRAGEVGASVARTACASGIAAACGWAVARAIAPVAAGWGAVGRALPGALGGAAFVVAFVIAARAVGSEEQRLLVAGVRRRVGRKAGKA